MRFCRGTTCLLRATMKTLAWATFGKDASIPIPRNAYGSVADSEHPCQTQRSDSRKSKNVHQPQKNNSLNLSGIPEIGGMLENIFHTPMSSFHRVGLFRMNSSISRIHSSFWSTSTDTPRERRSSSSPMKVRFSSTITRRIPYRRIVPEHMEHGESVVKIVHSR